MWVLPLLGVMPRLPFLQVLCSPPMGSADSGAYEVRGAQDALSTALHTYPRGKGLANPWFYDLHCIPPLQWFLFPSCLLVELRLLVEKSGLCCARFLCCFPVSLGPQQLSVADLSNAVPISPASPSSFSAGLMCLSAILGFSAAQLLWDSDFC